MSENKDRFGVATNTFCSRINGSARHTAATVDDSYSELPVLLSDSGDEEEVSRVVSVGTVTQVHYIDDVVHTARPAMSRHALPVYIQIPQHTTKWYMPNKK
ncbi:hypothetical protein SARC_03125 [Sphaeroforma arctica JP610]|uniref:Uncharacterized protein n=1 Tax=Sphaeroforma arctica JP610 TaxID=667725 RepID=A0A0L0G6W3_9EUKA|nr:hypothetical protein SARC_03125 [Sphaeroforma arctica JP610]KNC84664.1 hypothetical protein SARC_03125 [Sphaeroforma arctica JP610]|eukprot:XP_014158566.1 hypothetical protein SARC_03125 [Sphaeroforma arctica JP610]